MVVSIETPGDVDDDVVVPAKAPPTLGSEEAKRNRFSFPDASTIDLCGTSGGGESGRSSVAGAGSAAVALQADEDARRNDQISAMLPAPYHHNHYPSKISSIPARSSSDSASWRLPAGGEHVGRDGDGASRAAQARLLLASAPKQLVRRWNERIGPISFVFGERAGRNTTDDLVLPISAAERLLQRPLAHVISIFRQGSSNFQILVGRLLLSFFE